ncbi:MAG: small subunit ribosomal protein [Actinomycetota bacterium]|nr:small subunit ribosomal protein [Actinomycetota bacterium]
MANIKSQIKRNRQSEAARLRNNRERSALKTKIKKFLETAEAGDADATTESYRDAARSLDKAATKGLIHKNKAANQKSRLSKHLNS